MTDDIRKLLDRQAAWQKSRADLPWAEKVRMAEAVRERVAKFRRTGPPMKNPRLRHPTE